MDSNQEAAGARRWLAWWRYYQTMWGLQGRGGWLLAGLAALVWVNAGIYKVQPDEQGVVLRFGRWVDTTNPGLHYHWPFPFETVLYPKVTQVNQLQLGNVTSQDDEHGRQMLTGDENIVEADGTVLWRIKDAGQYLFRVREPEAALKLSAESALREVISRTPIQAALSDKRQQIADQTRDLLQSMLDRQGAGILVTQVQLQRVDPPSAVIDAFNDVQRARADQERARNEAEAYANDILPRAHGEAARIQQEADAYKAQVVNLAQGDAKSFLAVYSNYVKAKNVTAWRLYLDSVDEVLKKATKVIIDTSGKGVSGVVPYMPLSEKTDKAARAATQAPAKEASK
ncbi:FtsH protease activity modulator HflK [Ideonella sp. B508-1]|uniref:FtsH protease activity modulator HflK n=1 Tax=Ideonella sp. B508-1 TaxID=137716 RepID=UPI000347CC6F|nr:FtsH protease activity modulator HflK [Ideonella sp. B508-1]